MVRLPSLDEVALRWLEIEPLLKRATDRTGCYATVDILRLVMLGNGAWHLWLITDEDNAVLAVVVTHIEQFPRKRVCNVPFISGRGLRKWHTELLDRLDAFGRANGCACLAGYDRRGWSRFGFTERGAVMVRDL